jgi:hypothetical protein
MSVLDKVRAKFKIPTVGASKTSKSPSAGSEVPLHRRLNAEVGFPSDLANRVRAMAERWEYSPAELAEALAGAQSDPGRWFAWVARDEATFGRCVTPADFAAQYARISQAIGDSIAAPLSARQEAASREVLAQLEAHPSVHRAFVNRFEDGVLVVTLAIRGVGTGELKIPADRFNHDTLDDYAALLNTIRGRHD